MKNDTLSIYIDILIEKNTGCLRDYPFIENVTPNLVITEPFSKHSSADEIMWDWDLKLAETSGKA